MEVGQLIPKEVSEFIRKHTKQKDWTEFAVKNNVGASMLQKVIYGYYIISEDSLPVLIKIRDFAQKVRDMKNELENSK